MRAVVIVLLLGACRDKQSTPQPPPVVKDAAAIDAGDEGDAAAIAASDASDAAAVPGTGELAATLDEHHAVLKWGFARSGNNGVTLELSTR